MTEGSAPAAADPAPTASGSAAQQRRKPRRKRNVGKKNDATSNQQRKTKGKKSNSNNNNSGPPPPPQIKITIRNIQNVEKFGTVKSVLEGLVAKLIETCLEQKANNQYHIELDRAAFRHLITEEEKIEERRQLLIREKAQREEEKSDESKENDEATDPANEQDVEMEETKEEETAVATEEEKKDDNKLDVILAPKTENSLPTLTARPSYVVPPRKTRRRGERGGVAYLLLIGPKIKKKELPPAPAPAPANTTGEDSTNETKQEDSMEEEKTADGESGDTTPPATKETSETPPPPPEKVINYPQELAKGRLLLSNAIKALIELVKEDSKSQEFAFSGCIVEHSMNGKTWKFFPNSNSRPDRREGTIEGTADFKDWLQKTANQKEELKARPKPVPGGGMPATANVISSDEVEEDGQIVSSLVQHLRAKKLESKRKKSQKKKKKDENNKAKKGDAATENDKKKKRNAKKNGKNNNSNGGSTANGKKTDAAAAKAKRKKKERAKKNKEKAKAKATAGGVKPPTALLKPQPTAT